MAASHPEDNLISGGLLRKQASSHPTGLTSAECSPLATLLMLVQVPARVAPANPSSKENHMAMGETNRGLQNIKFDKNSHQISFGDPNTRIPVRDFFEYLREQGVDERDVLPVWQSGANKSRSNESTGRNG
jgi:hypothetical protein